MKKLIALLSVALMMFAFAGCGSAQEEATEAPAETTAAAEETTAAPATEATTAAAADDIGIEKATEIALQDAGLTEADVQFTKQQADIDDGVNIYEIEFTSGDTEYEYDIEAATGNIREHSTDSVYDD